MQHKSFQISCAISHELLEALEAEAFQNDQTRSATVREILSEHLRRTGSMALRAPVTFQIGQNNRNFRSAGTR